MKFVRDKNEYTKGVDIVYQVYGVQNTGSAEGSRFLIYRNGEWEWRIIKNLIPVDINDVLKKSE